MKRVRLAYLFILSLVPALTYSQGQQINADENEKFQSVFFDALQQKAMGNSDRAAMLLLDAKSIKPEHPVVHHELAKAYMSQGKLEAAMEHALQAVSGGDSEYWYLSTLMEVIAQSHLKLEDLKSNLPEDAAYFRINLARWYIAHKQPEAAIAQLAILEDSEQVNKLRLLAQASVTVKAEEKNVSENQPEPEDELKAKKGELEALITDKEWGSAYSRAMESIEIFPLQPFFYFAAAKAKWALGDEQEAIELLESGEYFLLGGDSLSQEYYELFANIHRELGNEAAYSSYINKID